jgi:hypothetical protein
MESIEVAELKQQVIRQQNQIRDLLIEKQDFKAENERLTKHQCYCCCGNSV